jgi:DNA-binding MarR family transcriptional regulator
MNRSKGAAMSDPQEPISFLVLDVARLIRQRYEAALNDAGLGITAGEARTLLWVSRSPGLRQAVLAEKLGVEPMTLVAFLDGLEKAGLIGRSPDPSDRRAKLIHATAAARPLVGKIETIALSVRAQAMGDMSERDMETVRRSLALMRTRLGENAGVAGK